MCGAKSAWIPSMCEAKSVLLPSMCGENLQTLLRTWMEAMQTLLRTWKGAMQTLLCTSRGHCAVRGSRQGLFPPRRFLCLHQSAVDDLTWPLSPTYPSWSGESAAAPTAGTSWPRLSPQSSERSWRPLTLDGTGWNVLYLISCQLRLIQSIWTGSALST